MQTQKKRKNAFLRYLTPFGLSQLFDITMLLSVIVLIVGLCILSTTTILMPIGFGLFIIGAAIGILRAVRVLTRGLSRRSPGFKRAVVSTIIMVLLFAIAVTGMILYFVA